MTLLKSVTFFALILSLSAFGVDEPGKRLDGLFTKLIDSDAAVRQAAIIEIVEKTEAKDMAHTVEWLLVVKRQGMFKTTVSEKDKDKFKGYQFVGCGNGHLCGAGWYYGGGYYGGGWGGTGYYGYYGEVNAAKAVEENKKMLEITREAATRSIRALGEKAVTPLIDLYGKRADQEILDLLADIGRGTKYGDTAKAGERAALRKRIYTFLSESYMKLGDERE